MKKSFAVSFRGWLSWWSIVGCLTIAAVLLGGCGTTYLVDTGDLAPRVSFRRPVRVYFNDRIVSTLKIRNNTEIPVVVDVGSIVTPEGDSLFAVGDGRPGGWIRVAIQRSMPFVEGSGADITLLVCPWGRQGGRLPGCSAGQKWSYTYSYNQRRTEAVWAVEFDGTNLQLHGSN